MLTIFTVFFCCIRILTFNTSKLLAIKFSASKSKLKVTINFNNFTTLSYKLVE